MLGGRLSDQEAVEGVAGMPGKALDRFGVDRRDRERGEAEARERPGRAVLDGQLPYSTLRAASPGPVEGRHAALSGALFSA